MVAKKRLSIVAPITAYCDYDEEHGAATCTAPLVSSAAVITTTPRSVMGYSSSLGRNSSPRTVLSPAEILFSSTNITPKTKQQQLLCPKKVDDHPENLPTSLRRSSGSLVVVVESGDSNTINNNNNMMDINSDIDEESSRSGTPQSDRSLKPSSIPINRKKAWQLCIGSIGIYASYLYYGHVQEDLFKYRDNNDNKGFTSVWFLQILESALTLCIGYVGRRGNRRQDHLPMLPFVKSGSFQLIAKILMSFSLAAGLSFPIVVLAKSAKIVPVMLGQLLLGGSKYNLRDYIFAILIVVGTSLLSAGGKNNNESDVDGAATDGKDTVTGVVLIIMSLAADGFTGGLQKKLKKDLASYKPTTYDFLFYSHLSQFVLASMIALGTGELWTAPTFLLHNPILWWYILASCCCSAIGQCFVFYVIAIFDPLVCTTITTTRKMISVIFSISYKGHDLNGMGCLGLCLAITALVLEIEGKIAKFRGGNGSGSNTNGGNSSSKSSSSQPLLPRQKSFSSTH